MKGARWMSLMRAEDSLKCCALLSVFHAIVSHTCRQPAISLVGIACCASSRVNLNLSKEELYSVMASSLSIFDGNKAAGAGTQKIKGGPQDL